MSNLIQERTETAKYIHPTQVARVGPQAIIEGDERAEEEIGMDMNRAYRIVRDAEDLMERVARDCDDFRREARDAADDLGRVRRFLQQRR